MKKITFINILFLFGLIFTVQSQSASDYFHNAANHYIKSEKSTALKTVREGIAKYPSDTKLKELEGKIAKLPDDNSDKNTPPNQQNKKPQPQPQPQQPQMSKENAQQILDALQQDEKDTKDKADKARARVVKRAEKDW